MPHEFVDGIHLRGFLAGETDFLTLFAQKPQETQDLIIDEVIKPCIDAQEVPEAGIFCAVTIEGHSDRDDTPGRTPEDRRANEKEMSTLRAQSARDFIFGQIDEVLPEIGATGSTENIHISVVVCGSAVLDEPNPGDDEGLRQRNRRVHFGRVIFRPETPVL